MDLIKNDYDLKTQYDFKNIQVRKQFEPDLPLVPCEESKIQQVIMNVIKNSLDATLGANQNLKKLILTFRLTRKKKMVCLEIEDNGPGIEESVLS